MKCKIKPKKLSISLLCGKRCCYFCTRSKLTPPSSALIASVVVENFSATTFSSFLGLLSFDLRALFNGPAFMIVAGPMHKPPMTSLCLSDRSTVFE